MEIIHAEAWCLFRNWGEGSNKVEYIMMILIFNSKIMPVLKSALLIWYFFWCQNCVRFIQDDDSTFFVNIPHLFHKLRENCKFCNAVA